MFVKITSLATLPEYTLLVGFSTGEYKKFDLKPLMKKYPPFAALSETDGLYKQARIDVGGYGIVWNDDLDLSADGVYEQGVPCKESVEVEDDERKFIETLVSARKEAGVSQKQLEILSGVAQPSIARTEKGVTDPSLTTLLKLLKPLGLTLDIKAI